MEVFSAQGHDPAGHWKLTGSVKKEFDKEVRSYVYALEGGASTTTTRMNLPKSDKGSRECSDSCLARCWHGNPVQWVWSSRAVSSSSWFLILLNSTSTLGMSA